MNRKTTRARRLSLIAQAMTAALVLSAALLTSSTEPKADQAADQLVQAGWLDSIIDIVRDVFFPEEEIEFRDEPLPEVW